MCISFKEATTEHTSTETSQRSAYESRSRHGTFQATEQYHWDREHSARCSISAT